MNLLLLMMTIGSLKYVTSQTTLGFSSNDFVRIIQKKTIDSTQVCESFDQSITWAHPAYGSSPVQVTYQNLWNDATNPKSVKMTVTMEPGYRPQMYNDLYHFIQISPSETYDRFESIVDNSTHLTSTEMTMLYSDVNFAAKTSQLEEYCRIQIPAADISQNNDGTLSFEVIVTLNQLKTCAEQRHVLTYKRTSNTGSTRCKYVTHPSTDLTACGTSTTSTLSASEECMAACDGSSTCNAFTFDTLSGACSLYPGAVSDLVYGNFNVSNTADNPHCKLAVPASGTDMTAYLLDPHTVQGGCYEYLLADDSIPTRRRLQDAPPSTARRVQDAPSTARRLAYTFPSCAEVTNNNGNLVVPANVTDFNKNYMNCQGLTSLTFEPNSQLTRVGTGLLYNTGLQPSSVVFPNGILDIGQISTSMSNSVVYIGNFFDPYDCSFFTASSVVIPDHVQTLGTSVFQYCTSLTTVTFGSNSSIEIIPTYAFEGTSLTSITIPASVKSIEDRAFMISTLSNLSFEVGTQLEFIGLNAFSTSSVTSAMLPPPFIDISDFEEYNDGNTLYTLGNFFSSGNCGFAPYQGSYTVPANIEVLTGTFYMCNQKQMQSITFEPNSQLKIIGRYALAYSGLNEITIPSSVIEIGQNALTSAFSSIDFETNSQLTTIGFGAFQQTNIENFTVPASVTYIGEQAFQSTSSLTDFSFESGSQINTIGKNMLAYSGLTQITIPANDIVYLDSSIFTSTNIDITVLASPGTNVTEKEINTCDYFTLSVTSNCSVICSSGTADSNFLCPASDTPTWYSSQTYDGSTLNIDFVVTSVQCKCPSNGGTIGVGLEHCDVPFYQKVTFTRTEDEDHTAASGTLIISDSQLFLLPEQDVQTSNVLEALTLNGTAFNFGSATVGVQDPNACKPENSTTTEYVNCGGDKAFIKPYQREEHMTISFKSDSALQMQTVTLKTYHDPNKNVNASTVCAAESYDENMLQGFHDANQFRCTIETFAAPDDVFWQYAPDGYDDNTPSQAYSFTFKGDVTSGITAGLNRAYEWYNNSDLVLNVVIEVTVSQAGARPSRRRLGLSSLRLMDGDSRNLRMLAVDEGVEQLVLSLPVLPTTGGGGLVVLSNNGSSSTNGTVATIPQTIVNQYHTTHHSEDENNNFWIVSIVLSSVAITLIASGMLIWFLRNRHQHGHQGVSTKHGMKVTNDRFEAYGEQTPMLSMRGLHVA